MNTQPTYYKVRISHLQVGDIIAQPKTVLLWNEARQSLIMQTWRLMNAVTEVYDEAGCPLWLAENMVTCEQRVIRITGDTYATVVSGAPHCTLNTSRSS